MKTTRTRKLLRITTFLAVSVGLAAGTHAVAATPADQAQPPIQTAQQEEQPQQDDEVEVDVDIDEEADVEEEAELDVPTDEEVDYPSDIEDFAEFIEEHREEGIENVPEYTYDGFQEMADAMEEVIPGESRLFRDRTPEHTQVFEDQHDAWEDRLDELSDEDRPDFAAVTHNLATDGAQWFVNVQQSEYPALVDHVEMLTQAAEEIDPDVDINMQGDAIQSYFETALTNVKAFYVAQEEDPLTMSPSYEVTPVSHPTYLAEQEGYEDPEHREDPGLEEPGVEEPGVEDPEAELDLTPEIQTYRDTVEQTDAEMLTGEEGRNTVVSAMRNLEAALGTFIEETPDVEIEGAEYGGDEPMMEEDEMAEGDLEELREDHETLRENIDELQGAVDDEEQFSEHLEETMENAANLLTDIQEEQFPQFEAEAEQLRNIADDYDDGTTIDEQSDLIMDFLTTSANALEAMDRQRMEVPVTLLF